MKMLWILVALAGCGSFEPVPESALCHPCVGPYDLGLASHREALGLE